MLRKPDSIFVRALTHKFGFVFALPALLITPFMPHKVWRSGFELADLPITLSLTCLVIYLTRQGSQPETMLNKTINYLADISYGIYMFHILIICSILSILTQFKSQIGGEITFNLLLYTSTFLLTILVSIVSHKFFETRFYKARSPS